MKMHTNTYNTTIIESEFVVLDNLAFNFCTSLVATPYYMQFMSFNLHKISQVYMKYYFNREKFLTYNNYH